MAQHDLGNWEMARGTYFPISQISQMTPAHLTHYCVGNLDMVTGTNFPISQKISAHLAQHIWEIGKLGNEYRYILPNFPKDLSPHHDLGNWEMSTGTYFPISQFPKRSQPSPRFGKLGNEYRYILPNFPKDLSPSGSAHLGNWEIGK